MKSKLVTIALVVSCSFNAFCLFLYLKNFAYSLGVQKGQEIVASAMQTQIAKALQDGKVVFADAQGNQVSFVKEKTK